MVIEDAKLVLFLYLLPGGVALTCTFDKANFTKEMLTTIWQQEISTSTSEEEVILKLVQLSEKMGFNIN